VKTEDLIVDLARDARPVQPLARPVVRLARWAGLAMPAVAAGSAVIGLRADVLDTIDQPAFLALLAATLLTALVSALCAFLSSVPGGARADIQRIAPLLAATAWLVVLMFLVSAGGSPVRRLAAMPVHIACIIEIALLGALTGWPLFVMLRRAAPLDRGWSAALAALAAAALGAGATQVLCPIDDPAHHLAGHFTPVVLLAIAGMFFGPRHLDWLGGRR
jgi:hypothetical protein